MQETKGISMTQMVPSFVPVSKKHFLSISRSSKHRHAIIEIENRQNYRGVDLNGVRAGNTKG